MVGIITQYVWRKHNIHSQMIKRYSSHYIRWMPNWSKSEAKTGAGFIVALTGAIMTMPGLPKKPAALNMDVTDDGHAIGLF